MKLFQSRLPTLSERYVFQFLGSNLGVLRISPNLLMLRDFSSNTKLGANISSIIVAFRFFTGSALWMRESNVVHMGATDASDIGNLSAKSKLE